MQAAVPLAAPTGGVASLRATERRRSPLSHPPHRTVDLGRPPRWREGRVWAEPRGCSACSEWSVLARILGLVFTLVLPRWVVPPVHAVQECDRVARRSMELPRYRATSRDSGVAAALVWFTLGEVSPLTQRVGGGIWDPPGATPDDSTATWCSSVTFELARAESWVALSRAADAPPPSGDDWRRLGVEPAPAKDCDREFSYGVWRALAWLLGVREDFPIYTSWDRAAEVPHDRPHLRTPVRGGQPDEAWHAAEQAAQDQAQRDARRHWEHVRSRLDATADSAGR